MVKYCSTQGCPPCGGTFHRRDNVSETSPTIPFPGVQKAQTHLLNLEYDMVHQLEFMWIVFS